MSGAVYDVITNRIVESLKQNIIPWKMSWRVSSPRNFVSHKLYRGVNILLLNSSRYTSSYWLTYKQAVANGGQVKKGERGTPVIFWSIADRRDDPTKKSFILKYYTCFNLMQCEGIDVPAEAEATLFNSIEKCEQIVAGYPNPPIIEHGGNQACYMPPTDTVSMPNRESFESPEAYYHTIFHELIHSSGAKSRLNREGITDPIKFASHSYSFEELIAETGASFLAGESHILDATFDNSAAYIQGWISRLQNNPKWIVQASGQAAKAADMILCRGAEPQEDRELPPAQG